MQEIIRRWVRSALRHLIQLTFRFLGIRLRDGLLAEVREVIEATDQVYITYHSRPFYSSAVRTQSDAPHTAKKFAIVIQGPIIRENNFTLETIKIYKKHYSDANLILSTWQDESEAVQPFKDLDIHVILNAKPEYTGISNINLQIISSRNGIKMAQELGVDYALKARTDQRIYAPNISKYLYNLTELFPLFHDGGKQRKRIIGVNLNTFKYRMYGLSDMLTYGHIDDLHLYWDAELDHRKFSEEDMRKGTASPKSYALWRVCEVYLVTEFLKKVERKLDWTLEDSWDVFAEHFCIVDQAQLDLFWPKYTRLEYRWLTYAETTDRQEIGFREWLNLYSVRLSKCGKQEINYA